MIKVLVGTEKPFAPKAVEQIREICEKQNVELSLLEKYTEKSQLLDAVKDVEGLIVRSDKVTSDVIDAGKNLKIIVRGGAGYDNVDICHAKEKGICVMNTPGQNSNAVAELAFGMMVYYARNRFNGKSGVELKGKTIGIHAYGNVGKNVARIAKGFGMDVVAFDPYVDAKIMENDGVKVLNSVEELYSTVDYLSLHIPSVPETQKFVGEKLLRSMKKGAVIVNTARKEVVDEDAVINVFKERNDLAYLSDIAPVKKEEIENLFSNQVLFTPKKMGAQTAEANINAGVAAINQIINYINNGDDSFQVNK